MIRLYGVAASRASRCQWTLNELGLAYEVVPIDDRAGETHTPEFLAVNPAGKVPCLSDGDLFLVESLAINLYLADRYGGDLWPDSAGSRGQVYRWTLWATHEVEAPLMGALFGASYGDGRSAEGASAHFVRSLDLIDRHLADREWFLDDRFTVCDLNVAAVVAAGVFARYDYRRHANLTRWLGACLGRPAAQIAGSTLLRCRNHLNP